MCIYGKAPTRQLHSTAYPLLSPEVATPEHKPINSFDAVIHMQQSTQKVPESAWHAVLSRMQLTLHTTRSTPHVSLRQAWCKQCLSGRSKPDVLHPDSVLYRNARVYGPTTTAMHGMSTPLPTLGLPPPTLTSASI